MKRRSPTTVGLGLGILAGILLIGYAARNAAPQRAPMLGEYGGPLRAVVMQYTQGASFVWPVYRAFWRSSPRT